MGEALNGEERCLNIPLIVAGALLHDIAKTQSLRAGGDHVEMGRRIVLQMGYPEVARIVERHVDSGPEILETIDEATIVNYSDKRVQHDRVVSLRERLKDLLTRYGKSPEKSARLQEMMRNIEALERAILSEVSLSADELEAMIQDVPQGPLLEESALKDFATQKSRTRGT
jgi:putative nucleotidyltransferase with HDIG domain